MPKAVEERRKTWQEIKKERNKEEIRCVLSYSLHEVRHFKKNTGEELNAVTHSLD
jgi:hypothetical protein